MYVALATYFALCGRNDSGAGVALTIEQALTLGSLYSSNAYTSAKYYVTGVIIDVYNTQYGNMKITDASGKILTIYGTYSGDGKTGYANLATKPGVGDEVTVYGIIGQYSGTPQMKNGWFDEIVLCNHTYEVVSTTEATCTSDGYQTDWCQYCGYEKCYLEKTEGESAS